jgi:hypothetical protein
MSPKLLASSCRTAFAMLALASSTPIARGQEFYEDPDYRFRIDSPGPDWKLLNEAEARALSPDAIAGLTDIRSNHFFVVLESAPGVDLDVYADILRENLDGEDIELGPIESVSFHDLPARRWSASTTTQGLRYQYRSLIFVREQFLFQLIGYRRDVAKGSRDAAELDRLAKQFKLLPGPLSARAEAISSPDGYGVSWRLKDRVFQDAAAGIEVTAPAGWRLAIGNELETMNDAACVGLVHSNPEAYVVLISECAEAVDIDSYRAVVELDLGPDTVYGSPVDTQVAGIPFPMMRVAPNDGSPFVFLHGTRLHEGRAVQVLAWCARAVEEQAQPLFDSAFRSIEWLAPERRAALAAELGARRDPENQVGATFCLRGGIYRDFEQRFTWTKPPGLWLVNAGESARATNEDATFVVEERELGIYGALIAEAAPETTLADYRQAVIEAMEADGEPNEPLELEIDGTQALLDELRVPMGRLQLQYYVLTTLRGEDAFQLLVWTLEGNATIARDRMTQTVLALHFPEDLRARWETKDAIVDQRLGYRLRKPPGAGWKFVDATPASAMSMVSISSYVRKDAIVLGGGMYVQGVSEGGGTTLRDLMVEAFRRDLGPSAKAEPETDATLAGLAAKRIELRDSTEEVVVVVAQCDDTQYVFILRAKRGETKAVEAAMLELFELVD